MTTACEALCAVAKIKPKPGEDFEGFAKRLTDKINKVKDADWQSLGDGSAAQLWHNTAMTVFERRQAATAAARKAGEDEASALAALPLPELEGYVPVPAAAEATAVVPKEKVKGAAKKKAKPEKKASASTKKQGSAGASAVGRRGSFKLDAKIKLLSKENPKRKGSEAEALFKLYKNGQTVGEALTAGVRWRDLRWDQKKGFIAIA